MSTVADLLGLAAFFGAPALFLGIGAGRRLARFGAPPALALAAGGAIGMACGAVLALVMILDVQSSTDANAALALILLPIPLVTNVVFGTVAAFVAFEWSMRRAFHEPASQADARGDSSTERARWAGRSERSIRPSP